MSIDINLAGGSLEEAQKAVDAEILRKRLTNKNSGSNSYASLLADTTDGQKVVIEAFVDVDPDGKTVRSHLVLTDPPEATIKRMTEAGQVFPKS